jgi:hypothetical protein
VIRSMPRRYIDLPEKVVHHKHLFEDALDKAVVPGGVIICDIELITLEYKFEDGDKALYKGVHAASTVCQGQEEETPRQEKALLFIVSAQRIPVGYDKEFEGLGIKYVDVCHKMKHFQIVRDFLERYIQDRFPWKLEMRRLPDNQLICCRIGKQDMPAVNYVADVVIGPIKNDHFLLSGKAAIEKEIHASSARGQVLLKLAKNQYEERENKPLTLSVDEIYEILQTTSETNPHRVVNDIKRREFRKPELFPPCSDGKYRFDENTTVAILKEARKEAEV